MSQQLIVFLNTELGDRGWSVRELARHAGLQHSSINRIFDHQRVGLKVCLAIASALNVPDTQILRLAGLIARVPADIADIELIRHTYYLLDESKRQQLVEYASFLSNGR